MLSADKDSLYRHFYATIQSGTISLWKANGPLATDYIEQVTTITGVADGCLRMLTSDNLIGGILSKILDSAGSVLMATTTVVSGSVADTSIDVYERLDDLYIAYGHTTNGITVVRSTDGGRTYS